MIASKTFYNRGTMVQSGEEFDVSTGMVRDYLLNGLAFFKTEPPAPEDRTITSINDEGKTEEVKLSSMKVAELRTMASQRNIANVDDMNKSELINALSL